MWRWRNKTEGPRRTLPPSYSPAGRRARRRRGGARRPCVTSSSHGPPATACSRHLRTSQRLRRHWRALQAPRRPHVPLMRGQNLAGQSSLEAGGPTNLSRPPPRLPRSLRERHPNGWGPPHLPPPPPTRGGQTRAQGPRLTCPPYRRSCSHRATPFRRTLRCTPQPTYPHSRPCSTTPARGYRGPT